MWILMGLAALLAAVIIAHPQLVENFWKSIEQWLNKTAANAVEKMFGYKARQSMLRATTRISYFLKQRSIKNYSIVYSRKPNTEDTIISTVLETTVPESQLHKDMVAEIKAQRDYVQQYAYKN